MNETEKDAKYIIERSYPKMNVTLYPLEYHGVNKRIVNLEIETAEKLPEEFFDELQKLVSKYQ